MNPRVLLSTDQQAPYYADAVKALGGCPEGGYLPTVCTDYDGLLLCGGCDVDPAFYGEECDGAVNPDRTRDTRELELIRAFLQAGKPVMGICRGHQILNVYFGGTLVQDLPAPNLHRTTKEPYGVHDVQAAEGSFLETMYGTHFWVNTFHHQAVKTLGDGLQPVAWKDDLVEAFVHKQLPVVSVQWHPEKLCFSQARQDACDGSLILRFFLDMCK